MISTVTTTTTTVTTSDVMAYSIIAVIALIAVLALKEILSAEVDKNSRMKSFVKGSNIAIVPLLLVFAAIVAYKVVTVI
ncbi:MAG: hypothetical protein PQ975_10065 [Methanobacterium sp.]|jgi:glucan phosphoethanolaminetransferase (alkaline phosphatase superfamily)